MAGAGVSGLLRADLLDGVSLVLAGARAGEATGDRFGAAVQRSCSELGARVIACGVERGEDAPAQEQRTQAAAQAALGELGTVDVLVVDGASLFGASPEREALAASLEGSWNVVRAFANAAFLPQGRGGRAILLAPSPASGGSADGARAGLENLARTLSTEWARYGVTTVAIALGSNTAPDQAGALVAYLASPAGAYFSGCMLDLRGPG